MGEARRRLVARCRPDGGARCAPPSAAPWSLGPPLEPTTEEMLRQRGWTVVDGRDGRGRARRALVTVGALAALAAWAVPSDVPQRRGG